MKLLLLNIQFTLDFTDVPNVSTLTLLELDSSWPHHVIGLLCEPQTLHSANCSHSETKKKIKYEEFFKSLPLQNKIL